jgi:hypothetical protein
MDSVKYHRGGALLDVVLSLSLSLLLLLPTEDPRVNTVREQGITLHDRKRVTCVTDSSIIL